MSDAPPPGLDTDFEIVTKQGHPDFLDLPWGEPLETWDHPRMVKMAHGISRHIVRFMRYGDKVYALKETEPAVARSEYEILKRMQEHHLPTVEPIGVVTGLGPMDRAMLITRYLDFSLPYWYIIGREEFGMADKLMNAGVVLLVRLHLDGIFWGDCSLSNILFRRDAGAMMAYLVDAETSDWQTSISDAMRFYDIDITQENIIGGILDLQAQGRIDEDFDPYDLADDLRIRYDELWDELTSTEEFDFSDQWRIDRRIRRINDLGFDVEELSISRDGTSLRIKPVLVDEGHHARELRRRTGLEVQENQARRLLADIAGYRIWLEHHAGKSMPAAVAAARWLADVYEPILESIPPDLGERLEAAEIFHEILEHRYYMAERLEREIGNDEALADYLDSILTTRPTERQLLVDSTAVSPPEVDD
ncbi:MAG: DUF4032 domain-containing protein [Acidimicrobiia bacterium]|nr:DUF4032 domain-containing protein [Acidimicrobiia bacterium]